jgi:hypothetical protein
VLHAVEPFVSSKDIRAGTRWQAEIAKELDDTDFGLICVTKENQSADWLNFEAGALAKSVNSSRVVPLAVDLSPANIATPLGQFQAMKLTKEDIGEVVASMNETCPSPIPDENLKKAVEKWWPDLRNELTKIEKRDYGSSGAAPSPGRTDRELIEELLDSVRGLGRTPTPLAQPIDNEHSRAEAALREFEKSVIPNSPVRAWSTSVDGDLVTVQITPPPTAVLRDKAAAIGTAYGVRFRVSGLPGARKLVDDSGDPE